MYASILPYDNHRVHALNAFHKRFHAKVFSLGTKKGFVNNEQKSLNVKFLVRRKARSLVYFCLFDSKGCLGVISALYALAIT